MPTNHTGTMPWDREFDELEKLYKELFPPDDMRYTFFEIRRKYLRKKSVVNK